MDERAKVQKQFKILSEKLAKEIEEGKHSLESVDAAFDDIKRTLMPCLKPADQVDLFSYAIADKLAPYLLEEIQTKQSDILDLLEQVQDFQTKNDKLRHNEYLGIYNNTSKAALLGLLIGICTMLVAIWIVFFFFPTIKGEKIEQIKEAIAKIESKGEKMAESIEKIEKRLK